MKTICAWCNKIMIDGPEPDSEVSHGICNECHQKRIDEYEEWKRNNSGPVEEHKPDNACGDCKHWYKKIKRWGKCKITYKGYAIKDYNSGCPRWERKEDSK